MELERVGAVTMGSLRGHVLGQVDDNNGLVRALFHTHTATDTKRL